MNNRWKFQIVFGSIWALVVSIVLMLIDLRDKSFAEQFDSPALYIRTGLTFVLGIFVFAYFVYRQNLKRMQKTDDVSGQSRPQ